MCLKRARHQAQRAEHVSYAAGRLPAVVYGQQQEPLHVSVSTKDFIEGRQHFGRTHLYHVDVEGGQKIPVLIKDIQVDRFRRDVQHIDFWAVDMSKDVTLRADLEMITDQQVLLKVVSSASFAVTLTWLVDQRS